MKWSPCGTRVLCVTEFRLRLTVWSLIDATCVCVRAPKFADGRGLDFSPDGKFLAFVRRERCRLDPRRRRATGPSRPRSPSPRRTSRTRVVPGSTSIAVHDAPHAYALILYAPDGRVLRDFKPDVGGTAAAGRDAQRRRGRRRRAVALGSGLVPDAGGRDRRCRVLNHVSWRAFADLAHADRVVAPATVAVYEETRPAGPTRASRAGPADSGRLRVVGRRWTATTARTPLG